MSSLNNLIEKLAGAGSSSTVESVQSDESGQDMTDPVYVEKLASAVDFIIDNFESLKLLEKEALSRDAITGRFVSDKTPAAPPEEESNVINIADVSDKIREGLRSRIAAKQELVTEEQEQETKADEAKKEMLDNVLTKLRDLRSDKEETTEESEPEKSDEPDNFYSSTSEDPVSEEDIFNVGKTAPEEPEEPASSEADGEAAVKAASAGQSLADVLNAALSSDEQFGESTPQGAETGEVHGSEGPMARKQATDNLKRKLMAKIGKEA